MALITRSDIKAHLEATVMSNFLVGQKQSHTPLRSAFCQEYPSKKAFEIMVSMGALPWPIQNGGLLGSGGTDARTGAQKTGGLQEGGPITIFGGEEQGMLVYPVDWEIPISISQNAIDDDQTGHLIEWAQSAAGRFEQHKDKLAFQALNSGDGTTYGKCYDTQNFYSNSHTDPGAEYQTNQDNLNGLTLSLDNFKTVKIAASKFLDSRGQSVGLNHNLLIVPSDLEYEAAQITTNREAYDTANREMNPYAGNVKALVAPGAWLDTTSWFLVDPNQRAKPLGLILRLAPHAIVWQDPSGPGGGTWNIKIHARYNVFYQDWRLAVMGNT